MKVKFNLDISINWIFYKKGQVYEIAENIKNEKLMFSGYIFEQLDKVTEEITEVIEDEVTEEITEEVVPKKKATKKKSND